MRWVGITLLLLFGTNNIGICQEVGYHCRDGEISFLSSAPLERIEARSNALLGIINPTNSEFGFSVHVNSFQGFNSPLQREHFNENYLESEKFPKATFAGKIIEDINFNTPGVYDVRAKGILTIHGIDQERIIKGKISIEENALSVSAKFKVLLQDHNISIPKIVHQKIAEEIEVFVDAKLSTVSL